MSGRFDLDRPPLNLLLGCRVLGSISQRNQCSFLLTEIKLGGTGIVQQGGQEGCTR